MNKINIAIVDDHNLFRTGLKLLLTKTAKDFVDKIFEASNGKEFIELIGIEKIDLALMDIAMPALDGVETTKQALLLQDDLKIIALTMYSDDSYYKKMIDAGVSGFLLKEAEINEVISAIKTVIDGNNYFSVEILCNLVKNKEKTTVIKPIDCDLSERELEILYFICQGFSNQEIGNKLFLSKRTVDKHRANILEKTNCKNTANLVAFSIKNNLVAI
jgi:DNA-binding NarL/FixJ family response regulator